MSVSQSLAEAERKARLRDIERENEGKWTSEDMEQANSLAEKAAKQKMRLVPERRVKNRAKFAQFIQENWAYLNEINYLTNAEKVFLVDIMPHIGFMSNCLVENIHSKQPLPCTQESLGKKIGRDKSQMSKIVKPLIEKGIIARSETGSEEYNSKSYALFLNPNIIISGDRDKVNPTLKAMFTRPSKELKKLPVNLL